MPNDLWDVIIRRRIAARRHLADVAVRIHRNQLRIARDSTAVARIDALEKELELAALELVHLVDDSPERTRPEGWPARGECA